MRAKRPPSTRCVGGSEPGATELKCGHSAFHAKGEGRRRHTTRESGRIPGGVSLSRQRKAFRKGKKEELSDSYTRGLPFLNPPNSRVKTQQKGLAGLAETDSLRSKEKSSVRNGRHEAVQRAHGGGRKGRRVGRKQP